MVPSLWCCLTPERLTKTKYIMAPLARGWPGAAMITGAPPEPTAPFVVWGQIWLAEQIIPAALRAGRPFYQIDNGFYRSARGSPVGYYRFMYRRPGPVFIADPAVRASRRIAPDYKPWRKTGSHIVLAEPGPDFGRPFGFNCLNWHQAVYYRLKQITDRKIIVRSRTTTSPLAADLKDAWALVTHSSNVAVDAVLAGIPVFVEHTSAAAPVGNELYTDIETPRMPERELWWRSLMCQQFTLTELAKGVAQPYLLAVKEQVEHEHAYWGAQDLGG